MADPLESARLQQQAVFYEFLAKQGLVLPSCPICGTPRSWYFICVLQPQVVPPGWNVAPPNTIPTALLSCGRCHYQLHFSWAPIQREVTGGT